MADGIGTKIFRQEAKFIAGAMASAQIPKLFLPQFAFVGKSNIDLLSENGDVAVPGLQPSSFWNDSQSFNKPQPTIFDNCTEAEKQDPNSPCYDREQYGYQIDPNQQNSDTLKKEMMEKTGEVEIDMKNKNAFALDAEAYLAAGNKLASIFPGIVNRRESNKRKSPPFLH